MSLRPWGHMLNNRAPFTASDDSLAFFAQAGTLLQSFLEDDLKIDDIFKSRPKIKIKLLSTPTTRLAMN